MSLGHLGLSTGLLGLFGIGLPKWLTDPYGYIRDKLIDLYNGLGHYVEDWIVNPPHPIPGPWLDYIYSNAAGLAVYLIFVVGVITIVLMALFPRFAGRTGRAAVVAIVIGGFYPLWFAAGNWLTEAGNSLTSDIAVHPANGSQLLFLPNITNVLGAIAGILLLLVVGGTLLLVFFGYEILFVLATLVGLPLFALTPLGDGFRRKFEQLIGIVIVTSFLGRLAAIGILSLTTLIILHLPLGDTAFGAVLTLAVGFILAIVAQFYILKHADRIYGNVTGRTLGTSRVTGYIETRQLPQRRDNDMARIQAAHIASVTAPSTPNPPVLSSHGGTTPAASRDSDSGSSSWSRFRKGGDG